MLPYCFSRKHHSWLFLIACLLVICPALPALAATASELLEKGIYAEETVGDLDKAIEAYEEVISESKDSIDAAAQAQYRIGTCYAKQNKTDQADAAFQSVVDNYPQATNWVARAKEHLQKKMDLLPVPWGDGDEMHYEMKLASGMGVGYQIFRIAKVEKDGRPFWQCDAWQTVTMGELHGKSRVLVDYNTFAPIKAQWRHTILGNSTAIYEKDRVVIQKLGSDEPSILKFDGPAFDNEQGAELFRRLPLKEGYRSKVNIIPILSGTVLPLAVSVDKVKTLEVPAGKFDCFRLRLDDLGQTFWISNDKHRYIVRFEAGGVVADLLKVRPAKLNQSTEFEQEHFSVKLPPDWYTYEPTNSEKDGKTVTWLLDPAAAINAKVSSASLDTIRKEHESPRAWLESGLDDSRALLKDFKVQDEGWKTRAVGDREATAVVYDYQGVAKPRKGCRIALFGDTSAVCLQYDTTKEEFEKGQQAMEKILTGMKVK